MVSVVLILPPLHGETLHKISPENSDQITILTLLEDLVVKEVMGKPPALLPEQSQQESRSDVHGHAIRVVDHGHSGEPHAHVERALVGIKGLGRFEHTHHNQLGTKVTVTLLEIQLTLIFVLNRLRNKIANVEFLHHGLRSLSVEGSKNVGHIITGMCEDNSASGVFVPVRDIVDFVLVNNPSILWRDVLLHFRPGDLLRLVSYQLDRTLSGSYTCIASLSHVFSVIVILYNKNYPKWQIKHL
mmetsp:Transcript_18141/g.27581  ORF Transcript_18141/g.27581 Transcript_18141/m.27581 type:complete len:243 (-) Transcript_18141:150-878(-)